MPGTASHTKVCLTSKGMKRVNSYGNGDHYVHIKIVVPKKLSKEQKALMQVSFPCTRCIAQSSADLELNCLHFLYVIRRHMQNWKLIHPARYLASHLKPTVSHLVGRHRRRHHRRVVRPPKIFLKSLHKAQDTKIMKRTIKVAPANQKGNYVEMKIFSCSLVLP